ncbi:hypothetical protein QVD17_14592 [Tagetes erecta]|uniref:Uncharacterized protein n=1 Tax=Tagetes erecta TaxID=13708 RepID=A0AAD8KY18_TARER|nr:hypothetical protein QVD17_14592 [Tagetes erecta]
MNLIMFSVRFVQETHNPKQQLCVISFHFICIPHPSLTFSFQISSLFTQKPSQSPSPSLYYCLYSHLAS